MGRKVKKSSKLLHDLLTVLVAVCLCISMVPVPAAADPAEEESSTTVSLEEGADVPSAISVLDDEIPVPDENGDGSEEGDGEETPEPQPVETPENPEVGEPQETVGDAPAIDPVAEDAANSINVASVMEVVDEEAPEPINEDTVAMVGTKEFSDLQKAVDDLKSLKEADRVIDITRDVEQSVTVPFSMTFNLRNNITWTGKDASNITCSASKVTITVNGPGTMKAADGYRVITVADFSSTYNRTSDPSGSLVLSDVHFIGNGSGIAKETITASGGNPSTKRQSGGIIFVQNTKINATSCTFTNGVSSVNSGGYMGYGGAIAISPNVSKEASKANTALTLSNCTFTNNSAYNGSAVSICPTATAVASSTIPITVSRCTFSNNTLSPALDIEFSDNSPLNIQIKDSTTFSDNPAGAVLVSGKELNDVAITNCKFVDNQRPKVSSQVFPGGALSISGNSAASSKAIVSGTEFYGNEASGNGGAAYISNCDAKVVNCTFGTKEGSGNTAAGYGGALYVQYKTATIENCKFYSNSAASYGGAVEVSSVQAEIIGCDFAKNETTASSSGGGAIYATGSTATTTIEDSTFYDNAASKANGGALYIDGTATITGSTFQGNEALYRGGAIYAKSNLLNIGSTTITGNTANLKNTGFGGATTAGGVHFEPKATGAVLKALDTDVHIYENATPYEFVQLLVNGRGSSAEIFVQDTTSKVTTVEGFEGLVTTTDDGSSYELAKYSNAKITLAAAKAYQRFYSSVTEPVKIYLDPTNSCNHQASDTAKVFKNLKDAYEAASAEPEKQIIVCSTVSVTAADNPYLNLPDGSSMKYVRCINKETPAGALFNVEGAVKFNNVVLDGMKVEAKSALVTIARGSDVVIENATFQNAKRNEVTTGDKWTVGGAAIEMVWGDGKNNLTINGGVFKDNETTGDGGVLGIWKSNLTINGGTFSNNSAGRWGGAINVNSSNLTINGGEFSHNVARREGGAIALWGLAGNGKSTTVITSGLFDGNRSDLKFEDEYPAGYWAGGAIYNDRFCTLKLTNVIATNNKHLYDPNKKDEYGRPIKSDYPGQAAIANCPTSNFALFEIDGALVYDNPGQGDISFYNTPNKDGSVTGIGTVSDVALGGGDNNWKGISSFGTGAPFDVKQSYYQMTSKSFNIVSNTSQTTRDLAYESAEKVIFVNNESYMQGSAIMNNGDMTIGADMKALQISKVWTDMEGNLLDESEIPESVEVTLAYVDSEGNVVPLDSDTRKDCTKTLSAENDWTAYWTDLGPSTIWAVVEDGVSGFDWNVIDCGVVDEDVIVVEKKQLTNTWKDERINISAEKWWEDQDNLYKIRPESIELTLKTDNGAVDLNENGIIDESEYVNAQDPVSVKPDEDGSWRHEFLQLPKYTKKGAEVKYLVVETPVAGYVSKVEPVVTGQKPVLDENGEQAKDENGELLFEDDYIWTIMPIAAGDEDFADAEIEEWRSYNITNTLEFADIEFTKSYEGQVYQDAAGNGNSTAVFRITGTFNDTPFYDNVVSANFTGEGSQKIEVKGLLVGAEYTIEELTFDGSGYTASGKVKQTFTLTKDGPVSTGSENEQLPVEITFVNTSDNTETPNQGVINRYNFVAGNAVWEQFGLKQGQVA